MSSGHPTRVRSERLPPGYVLDGKYEIVRAIGAGGFAYVYEANQLNIERPVAVKVLSPPRTLEDRDQYFRRFVREAKLAAQIRHPNVVTIHDYGVADEQPFIVMELLEGRELKHEIRDHGPMDPVRALPLFIECLDALGEAHDRKIVHKDLKPSNLFLGDPGGRREMLRILDFGVARLQEGESLTQSGRVYGTMRYMAPEYLRKQTVTPALDVYQMGLILVETLAGRPAIQADDHLVCITAHFLGELEIPESLLEGPLGPVLQKALAVGYEDRYDDAHAFRDALEAIDASSITRVDMTAASRLLNDYSGSMDGVVMPPPSLAEVRPGDTGGHDAPDGVISRPATQAQGVLRTSNPAMAVPVAMAAAAAPVAVDSGDSMSFPTGMPSDGYEIAQQPRRMTTLLIGLAGGLLIAALVAGGLVLYEQPDAEVTDVSEATVSPVVPARTEEAADSAQPGENVPAAGGPGAAAEAAEATPEPAAAAQAGPEAGATADVVDEDSEPAAKDVEAAAEDAALAPDASPKPARARPRPRPRPNKPSNLPAALPAKKKAGAKKFLE